jgi:hypothetical protein
VEAHELGQYQDGLRRLEAGIPYPIGDGADHFRIDHGPRYADFFSGLGEAHFLLALDGDDVVGSCAAVGRFAEGGGKRVAALYGADLKIAAAYRGGALARRFLYRGFVDVFRPSTRRRWPWRIVYIAAMRGERGDVMRSARGPFNPMKLARAAARLSVYFARPEELAALPHQRCPPPPASGGLNLSPDTAPRPDGTVSTKGRKDLRLDSTGEPWSLVHVPLGPTAWRPTWGAYLAGAGRALTGSGAIACFAIDERLADHVKWLAQAAVHPGATCTIYALRLPFAPRPAPWVHLATSEI